MQRSNDHADLEVTADGDGLTSRAGTLALRRLADRLGVGEALRPPRATTTAVGGATREGRCCATWRW